MTRFAATLQRGSPSSPWIVDGRGPKSPVLAALAFVAFLAVGCAQRVSVSIAAPKELGGAEILVDGKAVGMLEAVHADLSGTRGLSEKTEGATATISVSPGSHELRIVKPGLKPIGC